MNKKIPDAKQMFDTAEAFGLAGGLLFSFINERAKKGDYSKAYFGLSAVVANHAFAIEMYFKCVSILEQNDFKKGHELVELFAFLLPHSQQKIKSYYNDYVSKNSRINKLLSEGRRLNTNFEDVLQQASNAFVEHRYAPEGKQQTFLAGDLAKALRKYILELRPDWV